MKHVQLNKADEVFLYCLERIFRRIYRPILENEEYKRKTTRFKWADNVLKSNSFLKKALVGKLIGKDVMAVQVNVGQTE